MKTWQWLVICWFTFDVAFVCGAWWSAGRRERSETAQRQNRNGHRRLTAVRNLP